MLKVAQERQLCRDFTKKRKGPTEKICGKGFSDSSKQMKRFHTIPAWFQWGLTILK